VVARGAKTDESMKARVLRIAHWNLVTHHLCLELGDPAGSEISFLIQRDPIWFYSLHDGIRPCRALTLIDPDAVSASVWKRFQEVLHISAITSELVVAVS
jgi:hypothetical protein